MAQLRMRRQTPSQAQWLVCAAPVVQVAGAVEESVQIAFDVCACLKRIMWRESGHDPDVLRQAGIHFAKQPWRCVFVRQQCCVRVHFRVPIAHKIMFVDISELVARYMGHAGNTPSEDRRIQWARPSAAPLPSWQPYLLHLALFQVGEASRP